ncbi:hypothetical protein [Baaleninema simplex]|uniref:hypothetical protein n=1 Tax=Baaleninema simplex TaxID=2862350 RepID=UPI00034B4E39|nr:hypothetical protein [Baaleninema simplex]
MNGRRLQRWGWGIVLAIAIAISVAPALASSVESRVSRLESDLWQLRSQVRQLSSQVSRLGNSRPNPAPEPLEIPSERLPSGSILADDPMFERLATLVVEQKRRLDAIEERLEVLEQGSRGAREQGRER